MAPLKHERQGLTTLCLAACCVLSLANVLETAAQDGSGGTGAFEVASVKRRPPSPSAAVSGAGGGTPIGRRGQRFTANNASLRELIRYAFDHEPFELAEGGPRLLDDRFDVAATIPASASAPDAPRVMLRTLLGERFKLSTQWVMRERSAYVLVRARTDAQVPRGLKRATVDCNSYQRARPLSQQDGTISAEQLTQLTRPTCDMIYQPYRARVVASARSMVDLARLLSRTPAVMAPVVDRTELSGAFDFELEFTPLRPPNGSDRPDVSSVGQAPSLFVALEEQLGLRLERRRTPVKTLVVEREETPSEN